MAAERRVASQDRGRETQQRILDGAAEVFASAGYGSASLRSISEASGVSLGAINFHFRSKEQIARAVIEEQHARTDALAREVVAAHSTTFARLIHLSFAASVQMHADPVVQAGVELTLQVGDFLDPSARSADGWDRTVADQIALGLERGELESDLGAAALAETFLACFTGAQIRSRVRDGRRELLPAVRDLWLLILPGVIASAHRAAARRAVDEALAAHAA